MKGNAGVNAAYLQRLALWVPGEEPWDAELVDDYANNLRGLGLFRSVDVRPQEELLTKNNAAANGAPTRSKDGVPVLPLEVTVAELPFRSVGGSARYDTDTGLGVEGFWEHRNLFDNGEKLVVSAPIATQVQGIKAAFEKPAFLVREQRLLASGSTLRENTEAYKSTAASASAALERRVSRFWWASLGAGGQSGSIKENDKSEQFYGYIGPRASVRREAPADSVAMRSRAALASRSSSDQRAAGSAKNMMMSAIRNMLSPWSPTMSFASMKPTHRQKKTGSTSRKRQPPEYR